MPDLRSSGYSDTGPERGGAFWDVQRMGSHDSNPRRDIYGERGGSPPPWIPLSDGGGRVGNLVDRFSGLVLGDGRNEGVHQVIKALEDAESTIKQQLEENNVLKNELLQKAQELEKYRLEVKSLRPEIPTNDQVDAYKISNSNSPAGHEAERRWIENHSPLNPQAMVLHQNGVVGREETHLESVTANQHTYGSNKVNGDLRKFPGVHSALGSAGPSQYSTPSSRSLSPSRHPKEGGDQDKRFISSGNCLVPVSNLNSSTLWKQELVVKVREHEEEIAQLRKHLADYSIKEAQIRNEKYVLEKRIAYMRMAFDQQQQDLVDAASKAISYRQDIIEENIRLTYALQAAHAERSTFVSSLVPILSEHGLQPSVVDAQSIVSNLKVLFTHMQERFIIAENVGSTTLLCPPFSYGGGDNHEDADLDNIDKSYSANHPIIGGGGDNDKIEILGDLVYDDVDEVVEVIDEIDKIPYDEATRHEVFTFRDDLKKQIIEDQNAIEDFGNRLESAEDKIPKHDEFCQVINVKDVSYPPPPSTPPDVSNCDFDGGNANIHVSEVDTIIPSHATSSVVSSDMDASKMKIDATTILQHCKDSFQGEAMHSQGAFAVFFF
ncbi:hypothetical protein ZIOFF_026722 [Zingiber officinale]|uniref:Uncharacterized protein n=1 Tax=Zingiber officinale TaxID=94328 RepID=A0A8J5GZ94_ZINOF|nr:hypothetical protein ZIOFF_026722 [Zingiber officinale]